MRFSTILGFVTSPSHVVTIRQTFCLAASEEMPPEKRKTSAFKPPRPASKPSTTIATTPKPAKSGPKNKVAKRRSSFRSPSPLSSDNGEEIEVENEVEENPPSQSTAPIEAPSLTIPPKLLTKLLHHNFTDDKTRIGQEANELVGKYMETFVREALARAAFEKGERVGAGGDFLEVEDLERLAPQLILDF